MQNGMPSGPDILLGVGLKTACQISSRLVCGMSSRGVGYVVPDMSDRLMGSVWERRDLGRSPPCILHPYRACPLYP